MIQVPLKPTTLYHQKTILLLLGLESCSSSPCEMITNSVIRGTRDNVLIFCVKSSHPQTIRWLTILLSILQGFPKEMTTMWGKAGVKNTSHSLKGKQWGHLRKDQGGFGVSAVLPTSGTQTLKNLKHFLQHECYAVPILYIYGKKGCIVTSEITKPRTTFTMGVSFLRFTVNCFSTNNISWLLKIHLGSRRFSSLPILFEAVH